MTADTAPNPQQNPWPALWALVIGYVVWGDVPNLLAWCGIALLIGAGLFMMRQQRRR